MKVTVITCDNCAGRVERKKPRPFRLPNGTRVDLCAACEAGEPPVQAAQPLGCWPRMIQSASARPLLEGREEAERRLAEAQAVVARLHRELRELRRRSGVALDDLDSDLLTAVRDVSSGADRALARNGAGT